MTGDFLLPTFLEEVRQTPSYFTSEVGSKGRGSPLSTLNRAPQEGLRLSPSVPRTNQAFVYSKILD